MKKLLFITIISTISYLFVINNNLYKKILAKDLKISEYKTLLKLTREENIKTTNYAKEKPKGSKIFVINLEKHKDRLAKIDKQFKKENIEYSRFNAVLGHDIVITDKNGTKHLGYELKYGSFKFDIGEYNINCGKHEFIYLITHKNNILSAGLLGCYCSHYEIINEIIEKNYAYGMIFEDDVKLSDGFGKYFYEATKQLNTIPDFDILYFAIHMQIKGKYYDNFGVMQDSIKHNRDYSQLPQNFKDANFIKINDIFSKFIINNNIETKITATGAGYAYLVSNAGAKKIAKAMRIGVYANDAEYSLMTTDGYINTFVTNQSNVGVNWSSSYNGNGNQII
jgi:GR25 family glycosyltransferase involved in LPS biosynthesis